MKAPRSRLLSSFSRRILLACRLPLAGSLLSLGCTPMDYWPSARPPVNITADRAPAPTVERAAAPAAEELPPPSAVPPAESAPAEGTRRILPITLDAVLHMAEENNHQVTLAREKLYESETEKHIADLSWLPDIHVGVAYWRHEGGITNEDGTLTRSSFSWLYPGMDVNAKMDLRDRVYKRVDAERKIWQQEGELSRITSDTLLEASSTYIDLLTALTSEAILKRMEILEKDVLKWAEGLLKSDKSAEVMVVTIKAQLSYRRQSLIQVRQQVEAATARLTYLLGLSPDCELVPAESALQPVEFVDASQPTEALVARALSAGPGVRELEQMISVIQNGLDASKGPGRFLPIVEMCMNEGWWGTGPDSTLRGDNRWDMGIRAYWNLTDLVTVRDKLKLGQSRLQQAEIGYRDLQGKLTMGVQEAQSSVQASKQLITEGTEQIKHADKSYGLNNQRLKQRIEGSSTTEVLASIRVLEAANLASLAAIRSYDKAQVRLMVLMGAAGEGKPCK